MVWCSGEKTRIVWARVVPLLPAHSSTIRVKNTDYNKEQLEIQKLDANGVLSPYNPWKRYSFGNVELARVRAHASYFSSALKTMFENMEILPILQGPIFHLTLFLHLRQ